MKLLVIGLDQEVATPNSRSAQRQIDYFTGYDVDIVVLAMGKERHVELTPRIRVHVFGGFHRFVSFIQTLFFARKLVKKQAYDVITVQDPFFSGLVGSIVRCGYPLRLHVQDHSGAFARKPLGLKEACLFFVSRFIIRSADRIRTVSRRGAEGLFRFGVQSSQVDIVPVASDATRFSLLPIKKNQETHLVCVSRLAYEKGVDVLLRAIPLIHVSLPSLRVTIIGEGPERVILEHLAQKLGISKIVRFAGAQKDTASFIADADVYVQPSRFEGWGIAVIEAAAAGKPIVMTDVGCAGEVIFHEKNGIIVPVEDEKALADGIIRMFTDRDFANKLGMAARESVKDVPVASVLVQRSRASLEETKNMGARDVDNGIPIFFTALCIRLLLLAVIVFFAGDAGLQLPDTKQYLPLAQNLLAGNGFTIDGGAFIYRTIGYPLFLAGAYALAHSLVVVSIIQAIISSFAPLLVMAIGRRLTLPARVRRAAGWLTACEPHLVYYALPILTEGIFVIPFLFLVYLIIRFIQEKRVVLAVFAGIFFGITLLIKPLLQAFPVFIVILLLLAWGMARSHARAWVKGSIVCLLIGMCVAFPWAYRNKQVLGTWSLSNQGQAAMAQYLAPSILSVRDHISYQDAETKATSLFESRYGKAATEGKDLGKEYAAFALHIVKDNPFIFLRIASAASVSYWTSHNYAYVPHYYGLTPPLDKNVLPPTHYLVQGRFADFAKGFVAIFSQPFYAVGALGRALWAIVTVFMLIGIYKTIRYSTNRASHIFIVSIFIYANAMTMVNGLGIEGRLRYHLMPLIFLYAMHGWLSKRKSRPLKKLLILTQRVDEQDTNLGVHISWLTYIASRVDVTVIAQSVGKYTLPNTVRVFSLGKENGASKIVQLGRLKWLLFRELPKHDATLVLMVPFYAIIAGLYGRLRQRPVYLWYTHKHVPFALRVANMFVKRIFTASKASLRLNTTKKMVMGHAIDMSRFQLSESEREKNLVISVGRISRTKGTEKIIDAVKKLIAQRKDVHLELYGLPLTDEDKIFQKELEKSVQTSNIRFMGGIQYNHIHTRYQSAQVFVNMSDTGSLDKAVLEAMACGCPVVTSNEAFKDIVPTDCFVASNDVYALATAILNQLEHPVASNELRARVVEAHDMQQTLGKLMNVIEKDIS